MTQCAQQNCTNIIPDDPEAGAFKCATCDKLVLSTTPVVPPQDITPPVVEQPQE